MSDTGAENSQADSGDDQERDPLFDLLDQLRDDGYRIGASHYIAASELMVRLLSTGVDVESPERLRNHLAPLLCSSQEEQEDFYHRFDDWHRSRKNIEPLPDVPEWHRPEPKHREREIAREGQALRNALVSLVVVTFVFIGVTLYRVSRTPADLKPLDQPVQQPIDPDGGGGTNENDVTLPDVKKNPWVLGTGQALLIAIQVILAVGLIAILLRMLRAKFAIQEVLTKRRTDLVPEVRRLLINRPVKGVVENGKIQKATAQLRQWMELPSEDIDVDETVQRTVMSGGFAEPVRGSRRSRPHYLFLLPRATYHDQIALFLGGVVRALQSHAVLADRFFYDDDLRTCFPAENPRPITLRQLATQYPDSRLVIFADAKTFFSDWTGDLEPWIDELSQWSDRVLLTPESMQHWGSSHHVLRDKFVLLPATAAGVAAIPDALQHDRPIVESSEEERDAFPAKLRSRPRHWLDPIAPSQRSIDRLIVKLKRYLGEDGFYWLSACAVFPSMHLNLTLHLGEKLRGVNGDRLLNEDRLIDLGRLPWFRFGTMPDWLRRRLVADLGPQREEATRAVLERLLDEASEAPDEAVQPSNRELSRMMALEVATSQEPKHEELNWIESMGRKLKEALRVKPRPDPTASAEEQDYVFRTFISGGRIDALAFGVGGAKSLFGHSEKESDKDFVVIRGFARRIIHVQIAYFVAAFLTYLLGYLIGNQMIGDGDEELGVVTIAVKAIVVGLLLSASMLGLAWRRFKLTGIGLFAFALLLLNWQVGLSGYDFAPLEWWAPESDAFFFGGIHLFWICVVTVLGLVVMWVDYPRWPDRSVAKWTQRIAKWSTMAQWIMLPTLAVFFCASPMLASTAMAVLAAIPFVQLALGYSIRFTLLWMTGLTFILSSLFILVAGIGLNFFPNWMAITFLVLMCATPVGWLWISTVAYRRVHQSPTLDAIANQLIRESDLVQYEASAKAKRRFLLASSGMIAAIVLGVVLAIATIMAGGDWLEDLMKRWNPPDAPETSTQASDSSSEGRGESQPDFGSQANDESGAAAGNDVLTESAKEEQEAVRNEPETSDPAERKESEEAASGEPIGSSNAQQSLPAGGRAGNVGKGFPEQIAPKRRQNEPPAERF